MQQTTTGKTDGKGWKNALLKTGLPLENVVAKILDSRGYIVGGEFHYSRNNEQGLETAFSVDLLADRFITSPRRNVWGQENLLVECKYTYPTVTWVFAAHGLDYIFDFSNVLKHFDSLCTHRIERTDELTIDDGLPTCLKGVEIHEKDANGQAIARGLHQLRWALPQLVQGLIKDQAEAMNEDSLRIQFVCPILVTTAPLFVINPDVKLASIEKANDLEEIATPVEAVVCYEKEGPQLRRYRESLFNELTKNSFEVSERLGQIWERSDSSYEVSLTGISSNILVVNLSSLDKMLRHIQKCIRSAGVGLTTVARFVEKDEQPDMVYQFLN